MNATVPHVDALFGGRQLRFKLHRDRETIDRLEAAVGSVSACWGRFGSGDWTMTDLRTVLALAHPAEALASRIAFAPPGWLKRPPKAPHGVEPSVIDAVIGGRPLATYARLAMAVLTAALIGLPPEGARYDERDPIVAALPTEAAA